jgi:serine/threonine-protein kinase
VREDPRPPSDSNRDVSPDVDAIVLKALAKNPINRYQSSGEMRADVLRAAAGRPVLATPLLREEETAQMSSTPRSGGNRNTPARVGDARRRKASGWVIAALSALGVLAVAALTIGLIMANKPKSTTVPDLAGKTQVEAEAALKSAKLKGNMGNPATGACTVDKVAEQTPGKGESARQDDTVTYRICAGPNTVQVPKLEGVNRAGVPTALDPLKLRYTFEEIDSALAKDIIVNTNPPAGTSVPENTIITVRVSKGNMKPIPNVVGKTEAAARAALEADGFKVTVLDHETYLVAGNPKIGTVASQEPLASNTPVAADKTTVTIFISRQQPNATPTATPTS